MKANDDASSVKIPKIEALRAKKERVQEKRKNLLERFHDIEEELRSVFSDLEIFASGTDVNLEQTGEDDWTYGHLSFYNGRLYVGYRTTEEDYYHSANHLGEDEHTYSMSLIAECKNSWLERLSSEKPLQSLFNNLDTRLDQLSDAADKSVETLNKILEHQAAEVNDDAVTALSTTGTEALLKEWSKARASIAIDPEDSITRSSSYLESICKKILVDLNAPIPSNGTISSLISECIKQMGLSEDKEANKAVTQLFGNLKGLFQSVGAIRSNFGTAHGSSPDDYKMGEHYARLINNAAATASTFLLYRHHIHMNNKKVQD